MLPRKFLKSQFYIDYDIDEEQRVEYNGIYKHTYVHMYVRELYICVKNKREMWHGDLSQAQLTLSD